MSRLAAVTLRTSTSVLASSALLVSSAAAQPRSQPRTTTARKAPPPATPTVSVVGLKVVTASFRPYASVGTGLALALRVPPPARIVAIDTNGSTLERMTDSNGLELEGVEFSSPPRITKSGEAAIVELRAESVPGTRSSAVIVLGSLSAWVASGVRTEKVPTVRLQKGATFRVGGGTVTIEEVEASGEQTALMFSGPAALMRRFKAARAGDAGKAVELDPGTSSFSDDKGELRYRGAVTSKAPALEVDLWQDLQAMTIPLDVRATWGIPAR